MLILGYKDSTSIVAKVYYYDLSNYNYSNSWVNVDTFVIISEIEAVKLLRRSESNFEKGSVTQECAPAIGRPFMLGLCIFGKM